MRGMFDFLYDHDDYDERKIGRDNFDWGFISTAYVSDGQLPYETAVGHKDYHTNMIIVEAYSSKEDAKIGHDNWLIKMTEDVLPEFLQDCHNSELSQMIEEEEIYYKKP